MKIAFIMDPSPQPYRAGLVRQVARLLREWGAGTSVRSATSGIVHDGPDHDLYVIAADGDAALTVAADVEAHGGIVVNPYDSLATLRQPGVVARRLAAAGVPSAVPPRPRDVSAGIEAPQPQITIDGVGGHVFGVVRSGPGKRDEPVTLGPELHELASRCAHVLALFAVDLTLADGQPLVVAVRSFPVLRGVPDAALRMADFIYATAERAPAAPVRPHAGMSPVMGGFGVPPVR
jgi:glutathione synthase/RimK-type ligase-like ATP-grasp enzyme